MNVSRLVLVIAGVILLVFSIITYQTQSHHMMMMFNRVDYTSYFYAIIGIILIFIPYAESILRGRKETVLENNRESVKELEDEGVIEDEREIKVTGEIEREIGMKNELENRLKLAEKLLSQDEFTILRMIYENEGITQDSIHFRTGFSHSKISMIMKKLEERDLIVRERFGKTYKLYLSEWFGKEGSP
jgi:uncharacterized membrane protein